MNPKKRIISLRKRFLSKLLKPSAAICIVGSLGISQSYAQNKTLEQYSENKTPAEQSSSNIFEPRESYFSIVAGDGRTDNGETLGCRAFEARIGTLLTDRIRGDLIYENEGHPEEGHRDGFAYQFVYEKLLRKNFGFEIGAGPYFSMNTTNINGEEHDDKNLGGLFSGAILYNIKGISSEGWHLRLGYNHTEMPGAMSTDAIMLGFAKYFGAVPSKTIDDTIPSKTIDMQLLPIELNVIGASFKTNRSGTEHALGYQIEAKTPIRENVDVSASYIEEGKDELVDRRGAAFQIWKKQPFTEKSSVNAGVGPYFAEGINGLLSLELRKKIGEKNDIFFRFSRIADFKSDKTDRDMFGIGYSHRS
jgi:hypothetical protein